MAFCPKVSVHRHAGVKIITNHHDIKQDHSLDCDIYSRSNHLYFEFTPTCLWTLSLNLTYSALLDIHQSKPYLHLRVWQPVLTDLEKSVNCSCKCGYCTLFICL